MLAALAKGSICWGCWGEGVEADIQTPLSLHERFRGAILSEAVPV
jgi:hypothetical protein